MSFVIVKYGNEQEKLFNPNVQVIVFLNHVKKACGFEQCSEPIDLATDTGEVIDLQSFLKQPANAKEAARKYLDHRATYILVKCITETTEDEPTNFVPLLTTVDPKIKFSGMTVKFILRVLCS